MTNEYDGVHHNYTKKQGLVWQQVFLPPMAPPEWADREKLWNAVEEAEKTKESRLAREFVVALPVELSKSEWILLLSDFIRRQFVAEGMCADVAIHDTDGHNPHAHIMLTVRPLNENGTWQHKTEKEYLCVKGGEERGFTSSEFKEAQKDGWERQYQYKTGKKKELIPTAKAYLLIDMLPDEITYPDATAIWEDKLHSMSEGAGSLDDFLKGQAEFTRRLCELALDATGKIIGEDKILCPKCKQGIMMKRAGSKREFWSCSTYPNCRFSCNDRDGKPDFEERRRRLESRQSEVFFAPIISSAQFE